MAEFLRATGVRPIRGLLDNWAAAVIESKTEAVKAENSGIRTPREGSLLTRNLNKFSKKERDTKAIGKLAAILLHPANRGRVVHQVPFDDMTSTADTVAVVTADRAVAYNKGGKRKRILASLHETYFAAVSEGEEIFRPENRSTRHLIITVFSDTENVRHEIPLNETRLDGNLLRDLPDDKRRQLAKLARIVTFVGKPVRKPIQRRHRLHLHLPQRSTA